MKNKTNNPVELVLLTELKRNLKPSNLSEFKSNIPRINLKKIKLGSIKEFNNLLKQKNITYLHHNRRHHHRPQHGRILVPSVLILIILLRHSAKKLSVTSSTSSRKHLGLNKNNVSVQIDDAYEYLKNSRTPKLQKVHYS